MEDCKFLDRSPSLWLAIFAGSLLRSDQNIPPQFALPIDGKVSILSLDLQCPRIWPSKPSNMPCNNPNYQPFDKLSTNLCPCLHPRPATKTSVVGIWPNAQNGGSYPWPTPYLWQLDAFERILHEAFGQKCSHRIGKEWVGRPKQPWIHL